MSAPVKHTCPDINEVIRLVRLALKIAKEGKAEFKGELPADHFDDIESSLWGVEDMLEELRQSNDLLRKWGHDLEDEIKVLKNEIYELNNKITI